MESPTLANQRSLTLAPMSSRSLLCRPFIKSHTRCSFESTICPKRRFRVRVSSGSGQFTRSEALAGLKFQPYWFSPLHNTVGPKPYNKPQSYCKPLRPWFHYGLEGSLEPTVRRICPVSSVIHGNDSNREILNIQIQQLRMPICYALMVMD